MKTPLNFAFLLLLSGLLLVVSGCVNMTQADMRRYRQLSYHGIDIDHPLGEYECPNSPVTACCLNILPGIGNFYLASGRGGQPIQAAFGALNLLFWPCSILWGAPQAAIDAMTLNKQDMLYYYQFDPMGKKDLAKIGFKFE